jgi:D-beta-D-heptose 7-phosphate kinase/D-beta-D-heptose 1-phosphate adenosyltransferase
VGEIVERKALLKRRIECKRQRKQVVFTNGIFNLLTQGHVRLLERAETHGDVLIVAINSDSSAQRIKGHDRHLVPQSERAEILSALEAVDFVTVFEEDTPLEIVKELVPDVLVKGGWPPDQIVGRAEVMAAGGEVIAYAAEDFPSTTDLIRRIQSLPSRP